MRAGLLCLALLAGCVSPPPYEKPKLDMPVAWKVEEPFREGTPNDAAPKGRWWERFNDPKLNELTERALADNQTLAAAHQRLVQARATLGVVSGQRVPQVSITGRSQRFRITASDQLKHGLWVADVERLPADLPVPIPEDLQPTSDALQRLIQSLQLKASQPGPMPLLPPWKLDDCGWVANRWCELLPLPVALKQRLMELDNPLVRLELVSDVLTRTGITT